MTAVFLLSVLLSALFQNGYVDGYVCKYQNKCASRLQTSPIITEIQPSSKPGCSLQRCGTNAKCTVNEGLPVCSCNNLHMGDPLTYCYKVECILHEDCNSNKACINNNCVDACSPHGSCAINANCETRNHVATCSCRPGYEGDGYISCRIIDPCESQVCGRNNFCEVENSLAICKCLPGYFRTSGARSLDCVHECENDYDCPANKACSSSFKCENPCNCGSNANCEVINHQARCTCPPNWGGNPLISCQPECTHDSDCPQNKPVCDLSKCVDPCHNACGSGAQCILRNRLPVCTCPQGTVGNPAIICTPVIEDVCEPNPCCTDAVCTPGSENGLSKPTCKCAQGYVGDGWESCQRAECITDYECPNNKACIDYSCKNPCTIGHPCTPSAVCEAGSHIAICTCPDGTRGDATLGSCNPLSGTPGIRNYFGIH